MTAGLVLMMLCAGVEQAPRLAPPSAVTCPRDHVTSYSGRVVAYRRTPEKLALTIRTDWDTTERVQVTRPRNEHLLLRGAPFAAADWARIESPDGDPLPALRATAWVCDDGRPLVIDWQPPSTPSE